MDVKTVLFDLGNVVIYLNEEGSYHEFAKLGQFSFQTLKEKVRGERFFNDFETGRITADEFRSEIRRMLNNEDLTDQQIDIAWNNMLLKIDPAIIPAIRELSKMKSVMVLSNTNIIHEIAFHKMLSEISEFTHLNQFFHKVYLSHEIGERKPDHSSWQFILDDNEGMKAEEVLFLEDKIENLEAAGEMGFQIKQIAHPGQTLELIKLISG
ncbi:MAG: HAD family phosphatase [Bacteroidota bacterium]